MLVLKLKGALLLYIKKRRVNKGYFRKDIVSKVNSKNVLKIQRMVRKGLAKFKCRFMRSMKKYRIQKSLISNL